MFLVDYVLKSSTPIPEEIVVYLDTTDARSDARQESRFQGHPYNHTYSLLLNVSGGGQRIRARVRVAGKHDRTRSA